MLLSVKLIQSSSRVHLIKRPHVTSDILYTDGLIGRETTLDYKLFSMNMAESLESDYMLKPFN